MGEFDILGLEEGGVVEALVVTCHGPGLRLAATLLTVERLTYGVQGLRFGN